MRPRHLPVALALLVALALPGLAGSAAADDGDDCLSPGLPVADGYYQVCVFEEYEDAWSHARGGEAERQNDAAEVRAYPRSGATQAATIVWIYQYEGSGWWDYPSWGSRGTWSQDETAVIAHHALDSRTPTPLAPYLFTHTGARVLQRDSATTSCDAGSPCTTSRTEVTSVTAYHKVDFVENASATYEQRSTNGGPCRETLRVQSVHGTTTVLDQGCAAELPHLMDDPLTQFPDWPDGTGLPFL